MAVAVVLFEGGNNDKNNNTNNKTNNDSKNNSENANNDNENKCISLLHLIDGSGSGPL